MHSWCASSLAGSSDSSRAARERQEKYKREVADVELFMRVYGARGGVVGRGDKSRRQISMRLQTDLALLWSTLSVLRFVGMPGVQKSIFCHFFENIKFPALSLSSNWSSKRAQSEYSEGGDDDDDDVLKKAVIEGESNGRDGEDDNNSKHGNSDDGENVPYDTQMFGHELPGRGARIGDDGYDNAGGGSSGYYFNDVEDATHPPFSEATFGGVSAAKSKPVDGGNERKDSSDILHLPELQYLGSAQEDGGDPSVIDVKHDPLGVVQKLLDSAESCTFSTTPEERGPLLSTCLALAIKSGRLSLLAQVASVLLSEQGNVAKICVWTCWRIFAPI